MSWPSTKQLHELFKQGRTIYNLQRAGKDFDEIATVMRISPRRVVELLDIYYRYEYAVWDEA